MHFVLILNLGVHRPLPKYTTSPTAVSPDKRHINVIYPSPNPPSPAAAPSSLSAPTPSPPSLGHCPCRKQDGRAAHRPHTGCLAGNGTTARKRLPDHITPQGVVA